MEFVFQAERVLDALARIQQLTFLPAEPSAALQALGPAVTALSLFDRSRPLISLLRYGRWMSAGILPILKARAAEVAPRFEELFPATRDYGLVDLEEAVVRQAGETITPSASILRALSVAADPGLPPLQNLLGGLVVFQGGGAGMILWDDRLIRGSIPYPLNILTGPWSDRQRPPGGIDRIRHTAPPNWVGMEDLCSSIRARALTDGTGREDESEALHFESGGTKSVLSLDPGKRSVVSLVTTDRDSRIRVTTTKTIYDPEVNARQQMGFVLQVPADGIYALIERWVINDVEAPPSPLLDPQVPSFFMFPGFLWRVMKFGGAFQTFPYGEIAGEILTASLQAGGVLGGLLSYLPRDGSETVPIDVLARSVDPDRLHELEREVSAAHLAAIERSEELRLAGRLPSGGRTRGNN